MPYSDGSFPYGSPVVTTASGHTYKCNSFSVDNPGNVVQIIDQNGAPSGSLVFPDFMTGSMELQIPNTAYPIPVAVSDNGTLGLFVNVNIVGTNANIYATSVSTQKPQRGVWLSTVTWQKSIN